MEENTKRMLAGKPYRPGKGNLSEMRRKAHLLSQKYNQIPEDNAEERNKVIDQLLPDHGKGVFLQGPIQFDYGCFTHLGDNFYANFNLTVLDTCPITIGKNVMCGPNVSLITPLHPLMYEQRNPRKQADGEVDDIEYGAPITIGDNCWLASNVTVCPGVTIGNGCVIGTGAVVTKDVPDNSLVVGVPGKVIRKITEKDRLKDFPY